MLNIIVHTFAISLVVLFILMAGFKIRPAYFDTRPFEIIWACTILSALITLIVYLLW